MLMNFFFPKIVHSLNFKRLAGQFIGWHLICTGGSCRYMSSSVESLAAKRRMSFYDNISL